MSDREPAEPVPAEREPAERHEQDEHGGLAALFVDRPILTLMVSIALIVVGVVALTKLPLRLVPEGLSADSLNMWIPVQRSMPPREVEDKVLKPLEELLRTIPGVGEIRARASSGTAYFRIELDKNMDPVLASAEVRDRAQRARLSWPRGVDRYYTWREDGASAPLAYFQLLTPEHSPEWDYLMDQVVRPRLEAVDGVGRVEMWGLLDETLRIWFDRDKLLEHRVEYGALLGRLAGENFTEPVGELDNGSARFLVRVDSRFRSQADIESYPVRPGLAIRDIARVERVASVRDNLARYDQLYTYTGVLRAASGTNPVDASRNVRACIDELKEEPRLQGLEARFLFDQGAMIEESLQTLLSTSLQGGLLALGVLFLFLRSVRLTLVIGLAIPMALMISASYLFFTGGSLNLLTMAGMTLAVGMVVDNSVVVLENIRRLRLEGLGIRAACIRGTREVVLAISMATLTTVVVILPLIFMGSDSNVRTSLAALGMPLSIALLGSLLVALLLLPSGMRQLGTDKRVARGGTLMPRWSPVTWLLECNRWLLSLGLRHRILALLAGIILIGTIVFPASQLDYGSRGGGLFRGGDVTINMEIPRGRTLREVDQEVKDYESFLLDRKDEWRIEHVSARYGRSSARIDITLDKAVPHKQHFEYRRKILAAWPRRAGTTITLRDSGGGMGGGGGGGAQEEDERNFVVRVWGPDSEYLAAKALELRDRLAGMPEVETVEVGEVEDNEEVVVEVDRDRASDLRVASATLERTMSAGLRGMELTRFEEADREVRLIAQFDAERDPTLWDLKETRVWGGTGTFQRLDDVAKIRFKKALGSIQRLDGKTHVSLVGERQKGVSSRAMSDRLRTVLDGANLPRGYSWTEASQTGEIQQQLDELLDAGFLSVALVFLLMGILFESVILPGAILVTIPFALLGAYWSLYLFFGGMDVMAGIGMLLLCGVVVNNGIVLLDCIERLRHAGMDRNAAILEGTRIRLRPIVMTAATTIAGLLPMALFGESTGQGVSYVSMSIAVAGGLAFSTVFTAVTVPMAYTFFDDFSNWLRGIGRRALEGTAAPHDAGLPVAD